jgi:hypothetical protein
MQAGEKLADLLAQENAALKRLDFAAAVALTSAKEAALAELSQQQITAPLLPSVAALGRVLAERAAENEVLLERAIAVQTRIVRIVARAAAPPPAVRYGGPAERPPRSGRVAALAVSTRA